MDKDYHELEDVGRNAERPDNPRHTEPTHDIPEPANIETREVGSKYLKPGDKVRVRPLSAVAEQIEGTVKRLADDRCEALIEIDGEERGWYDVRDLVKRA